MKVVILAGGLGARFGNETINKPKPMISLLGRPILYYIIKHYTKFKHKEFIICGGYKLQVIKKYFEKKAFKTFSISNSDKNYTMKIDSEIVNVVLSDTGQATMSGGRIRKIKKYIKNDENFLMTYGDGISDVNLKELIKTHNTKKSVATLTAVRPPARFGSLEIKNKMVNAFYEKTQKGNNFINGGFFVLNKRIFKYLKKNNDVFETHILPKLAKKKQLACHKHLNLWMCMDTKREKDQIVEFLKTKYGKKKFLEK